MGTQTEQVVLPLLYQMSIVLVLCLFLLFMMGKGDKR